MFFFQVVHFSTKKVMVLKMNKEAGNRGEWALSFFLSFFLFGLS